jgi:hypothetical protein
MKNITKFPLFYGLTLFCLITIQSCKKENNLSDTPPPANHQLIKQKTIDNWFATNPAAQLLSPDWAHARQAVIEGKNVVRVPILNVDKTSLLNANGGITLNGNPFNAKAAGTTSFPTGNNTNYYSQHPPEVFFIQEPNAKQLKTYLLNFVPTDKNKEFGQDGQWTGTLYEWNLEGDTVLVQEIYKSKLIDRYAMKQYAPNVSNNQSKTSEEKLSLNDNKISKTWFGKLFDALADFIGWI